MNHFTAYTINVKIAINDSNGKPVSSFIPGILVRDSINYNYDEVNENIDKYLRVKTSFVGTTNNSIDYMANIVGMKCSPDMVIKAVYHIVIDNSQSVYGNTRSKRDISKIFLSLIKGSLSDMIVNPTINESEIMIVPISVFTILPEMTSELPVSEYSTKMRPGIYNMCDNVSKLFRQYHPTMKNVSGFTRNITSKDVTQSDIYFEAPTAMSKELMNLARQKVSKTYSAFSASFYCEGNRSHDFSRCVAQILYSKNRLLTSIVYRISMCDIHSNSYDRIAISECLNMISGSVVEIDVQEGIDAFGDKSIDNDILFHLIQSNPGIVFVIVGCSGANQYSNSRYQRLHDNISDMTPIIDVSSDRYNTADSIHRIVSYILTNLGYQQYIRDCVTDITKVAHTNRNSCELTYASIVAYLKNYIALYTSDMHEDEFRNIDIDRIAVFNKPLAKRVLCMQEASENSQSNSTSCNASNQNTNELDSLIGLSNIKSIINKIISYYRMIPVYAKNGITPTGMSRHMVFTGNPGTAKTTTARCMYDILLKNNIVKSDRFVEVGRQDLVAQYVGQTAPKVKDAFDRASGGMLFIDEAYSLSLKDAGGFGEEAVATLVQEMENHRDDVIVILAGYKDEMESMVKINPGLRSRIAFTIDFPDYKPDELSQISEYVANNNNFVINDDARKFILDKFSNNKLPVDLGNGRFARNLIERSIVNHSASLINMKTSSIKKSNLSTLTLNDVSTAWSEVYADDKKVRRAGF